MNTKLKATLTLLVYILIQTQTGFAQTAPGDKILNSKATYLAPLVYPETAKKSGVRGAVNVKITVDEKGNVIEADAVSGEILLRDAALAAARASKFPPEIVNGTAIKMKGILVFDFDAALSTSDDLAVFSDYLNDSKIDFWGTFEKLQKSQSIPENISKNPPENSCSKGLDFTVLK